MFVIDLHIHSTCSDGDISPVQIIQKAHQNRISIVSITDHDNLDSYKFVKLMYEQNHFPDDLIYIPGIELFSESAVDRSSQHLGVYFPFLAISNQWPAQLRIGANTAIEYLEQLKRQRVSRNLQIIENLNIMHDFKLNISEFCQMNNINEATLECPNTIGRPHIGRYLMKKGLVKSVSEAFDTIISNDSPAVIPTQFKQLEEFTREYVSFGAKCIICHPNLEIFDVEQLKRIIASAQEAGITGIERYHSETDYTQLQFYQGVVSIGSDYHGVSRPQNVFGNRHHNSIMKSSEKLSLLKSFFEDKLSYVQDDEKIQDETQQISDTETLKQTPSCQSLE